MPVWLPNSNRQGWDLWVIGWGPGDSGGIQVSDTLELSDSIALEFTALPDVSDTLELSDSLETLLAIVLSTDDALALTDAINLSAVGALGAEDAISLSDDISILFFDTLSADVSDIISLLDAVSVSYTVLLSASVSDSLEAELLDGASTGSATSSPFDVSTADDFTVTDAVEAKFDTFVRIADILILQDRLDTLNYLNPQFGDNLALLDYVDLVLGIDGSLNVLNVAVSDAIVLTESVSTLSRDQMGIDDYYRRHLNDRIIEHTDNLEWFEDSMNMEDAISIALT